MCLDHTGVGGTLSSIVADEASRKDGRRMCRRLYSPQPTRAQPSTRRRVPELKCVLGEPSRIYEASLGDMNGGNDHGIG